MRSANFAVIACLAVTACDRPDVLVICHNANCVEPTDPGNDDTLPALRESLALTIDGRPAIDGVEIDVFWRAEDDSCLFAHDLDGARTTLITEAADIIAEHITQNATLTASTTEPFHVFIELKAHVAAPKTARHTPAQRTQHAQCVWGIYQTIITAAEMNARDVEIVFASFAPELLAEMVALAPPGARYRLDAFYGIPKPLDSETRPLSDYHGLDISIVEMHPQWIHDAQHEGLLSQGVDVVFWMFSATVETFAAIEQYEPAMVVTSEATLFRRWLAR